MSKSKWPKRTLVVACLLMSGVATQVTYEPGFFLRTIASAEQAVEESAVESSEATAEISESVEEATEEVSGEEEQVSELPNHQILREKLDLIKSESSSLKEEALVLISKLEDKSKSSQELQRIIDEEHSIFKGKGEVMLKNFDEYIKVIQDPSKISSDVSEEQRKALATEVFLLLSEFSKASEGHEVAIFKPEELVKDAKIREHSDTLASIEANLCEQKQAVSSLIDRVEKLIEDKEEVVAEVEENEDVEGEEDVADSTEDTIDYQNYLMGMYMRPMYSYTPFMLNPQSPYDLRFSTESYLMPTMISPGYGQGFGYLTPQYSLAPQIVPQAQTDFWGSYLGTGHRSPSSTMGIGGYGSVGIQSSFGPQESGNLLGGSNIDMNRLQFGNDFTSNSSMGAPAQVMRIPQYSRSIIDSNATRFPVVH